jgi:hypothetical protein
VKQDMGNRVKVHQCPKTFRQSRIVQQKRGFNNGNGPGQDIIREPSNGGPQRHIPSLQSQIWIRSGFRYDSDRGTHS